MRWLALAVFFVLLTSMAYAVDSDSYEPDGTWQASHNILTNGSLQSHTFHNSADHDFVNFTAVSGVQYTIDTHDQSGIDTEIWLYSTDGSTQLQYNDDIEDGHQRDSRIVFDCVTNGTYFVKIGELYDYAGSYTIGILEQGRLIPSLVSHTTNSNVTKNRIFDFTSSVTCLSADCYNITATLDPIKSKEKRKAEQEAVDIASNEGNVDVIVIMKDKGKRKEALSSMGKDFSLGHEFSIFSGFSGRISKKALEKLEDNEDVKTIYYDRPVHASLDVSIPQIKADKAWARQVNGINITGQGQTICILDTGISYDHADFGGCALTSNINDGSCPKVVGGYDYVNSDNNPYDDNGHGSHVAGIAASEDSTYRGVAHGAKIAAVKVLNAAGSGSSSNVISGIEWCVNNALALNITSISMSLGDDSRHGFHCLYEAEQAAIDAAVAAGIPVFAAAGNDDYTDGISGPACIENATSVGSVNSGNSIAENRARILDMLAPGVGITATDYSGSHTDMTGTSMATPHAAAIALLVKQYARLKFIRNLTAEQIKHQITSNGLNIFDSSSSLTFPRIDALAAISAKGIIPTTAGAKPFYSLTPNPHNASCLEHISLGQSCNTTWQVNVTGDLDDTYTFFVIYEAGYKKNVTSNVNLTITNEIIISLNEPENNLVTSSHTLIFNCTANVTNLANITLYGNFNGTWMANSTKNMTGSMNSTYWNISLADNDYTWSCRACNSIACYFPTANSSLTVDSASPQFYNLSYTAVIELGDEQSISLNVTDSHLRQANISYQSNNYTMSNESSNFSYRFTTENNGTINFTIYATDTAGNMNSTSGSFEANDTTDEPRVKSVSLSSTIAYNNNQTITAMIYDKWQPLSVYLDHNGTNITMPNSSLANFSYTWAVSQCGTISYKIFAANSMNYSNLTTGSFISNNCCGNSACESGESCSSCAADCGSCPTASSSGGGGGAVSMAAKKSENFVIAEASPTNPIDVKVKNSEIAVNEVRIEVNKDIKNAKVYVTELETMPKIGLPSTKAYKYLEIKTEAITADDITKAKIDFSVEQGWLETNHVEKNEVSLYRYKDSWQEQETSYLMAIGKENFYSAEVEGFSYFMIGEAAKKEEIPPEKPAETKQPEVTAKAVAEEIPMEKEPNTVLLVWFVTVTLFYISGIVYLVISKKQAKRKK